MFQGAAQELAISDKQKCCIKKMELPHSIQCDYRAATEGVPVLYRDLLSYQQHFQIQLC